MAKIMHTVGDIASDAIKYRSVVELIKDSGYLDEEMEEKLDAAVSITEKAQYLGEMASLLEKLGLIREGGTISRVALSGIGATKAAAGAKAAGLVGGSMAGAGATAALSGAGGAIATYVAGGALTAAAAPIVAGVAVAGAVGWGISKVWSSIWD